MASISLCMIVKNEEKDLPQCLNSVKELVDEIIIVDTGSVDKTKEVASQFTNKIFDFEWVDNFSTARNFSLTKATKDWILILDADEIISKEDFVKIKSLIEDEDVSAVSLTQRNYTNDPSRENFTFTGGDFLGYSDSIIVRLFKSGLDVRFTGRIHEVVEPLLKEKSLSILHSAIPIHHYKENKSIEDRISKLRMYGDLLKKKVEEEENNPKAYHELGILLKMEGKFSDAVQLFARAIELKPEFAEAEYSLGVCHNNLKNYDSAIAFFLRLLDRRPNYANAYFSMGVSYISLLEYQKGIDVIEQGLTIKEDIHALTNLAAAYEKLGNLGKAEKILSELLQKAPKFARAWHNLGVVLEKQGKSESIQMYQRAVNLQPKAQWFVNYGVALDRAGKVDEAFAAFKKAVELDPRLKEKIKIN